ncbi:MAG: low molecular weight protein-tyrosine-phosphatase [Puniceicoccaceae bacterium]
MVRILFVCMGNICRSPAAEGVFRSRIEARGLGDRVECDSAGTIHFHAGERADPRMRAAAARRGYDLASVARGFEVEDFDRFDWIVTMDEPIFRDIRRRARGPADAAKIMRFTGHVSLKGVREVPDPYYGGADGFARVLDILEDGCDSLLDWVIERHGLSGTTA